MTVWTIGIALAVPLKSQVLAQVAEKEKTPELSPAALLPTRAESPTSRAQARMDVADTASTALATVPAPMLRANQSVIERDDMRESSMDKGKVARIVGTAAVIAIVVFAITARFLIKT